MRWAYAELAASEGNDGMRPAAANRPYGTRTYAT
jgi:hypothetical protein